MAEVIPKIIGNLIGGEKPEFGNVLHIQAIKQRDRFLRRFKADGMFLNSEHIKVTISVELNMECPICTEGKITAEVEDKIEYDISMYIDDDKINHDLNEGNDLSCNKCKRKYHIENAKLKLMHPEE